jgi:hypothetical protein
MQPGGLASAPRSEVEDPSGKAGKGKIQMMLARLLIGLDKKQ